MPDSVGLFVVIEGPNGVGKTTVCRALGQVLALNGIRVHVTAEPTETSLGRAIRELDAAMPAVALALSCAADRADHLARDIQPRLASGVCVVCDRYVPSSLVLQRIDGLDLEWIWTINKHAIQPDLTAYLEDEPNTIGQRLDQRGRRSRFELQGSPTVELNYYRDARDFLTQRGWNQTTVDCRSHTAAEVTGEVVRHIFRTSST